MKTKIALLLFTLFAVNAFAAGGRRAATAVEIRYTSIGAGIDSQVAKQIESLLVMPQLSGQVEYVRTSHWGFEGESTVCVQFKDFNVAREIGLKIEALVKTGRYTTSQFKLSCDPNDVPKANE